MKSKLEASSNADRITVTIDLAPQEFQKELAESSVYVRPASTDSLGVAVWEAIALGTPVVASDVCERPVGVRIFPNNDKAKFFQLLGEVLDNPPESLPKLPDTLTSLKFFLDCNP